MPAFKRRVKQAAAQWLSLPPDAIDDISRVTILDGREVIVEHLTALLRVEANLVEMDLGKQGLRIVGSDFEVNLASQDEVHLTGRVDHVAYVRREEVLQ